MKKSLAALLGWMVLVATVFAEEKPTYPEFAMQKSNVVQVREGIGNVVKKLEAGGDVTIAYFGGSITAQNGWRPKTTAWLKTQYPKANIHEIHAAIGGTGSDLGVYRNAFDVLRHKPDLVFVEFATNDSGASPVNIWKNMEGIVRQTWRANPETDIVYTYTFTADKEPFILQGTYTPSASAMEMLADFYGIPSINFCPRIVSLKQADQLVYKSNEKEIPGKIIFSGDGVHPHDAGHEEYLKDILQGWNAMKTLPAVNHAAKLEKCFVADNNEAAKMVDITPDMLKGNWTKLAQGDKNYGFTNRTGEMWTANAPGSTLTFRFKGSAAKIYDVLGPDCGQVTISVDGKEASKPIPRFDSYCTWYRLATLRCCEGLDPNEVHTVVVTIHPEQPDRHSVAFRLKDPEKELAEPKFQGTNVWFGKIMLMGDLVK
ncbi:MAG: GDSL-type esterase/lipase family protein [Planctomycetia bacterium]|nr:GDSL-type esterase/lipase family protein [Planctomycetia bacterium]